jgi:hypothetical protein
MMKGNNLFVKIMVLAGAAILVFLVYYFQYLARSNFKRDFEKFNASELNGRLTYKYASKSGEKIRLDNQSTEYNFISDMTAFNDYSQFYAVAGIGDSVSKKPFADTLYLKKTKTGQVIKFTFEKPAEAKK